MRFVVGVWVVALAGCGAPKTGPQTLAAADFRLEEAPSGSLEDEAREDQERLAREWIAGHVPEAEAALSQDNPEAALGIASTLHKVATDRKLDKLDAELVQPIMQKTIGALIAKSTTTDRAELGGLIGFLDAQHDLEARAAAGQKFSAQVQAQRELATTAEASGHKLSLYLHHALVDYFSLTRVDDKERTAKEADVHSATSIAYTVMDASDCHGTLGTINDFNSAHAYGGRQATVHIQLTKCSVEKTRDDVTSETKDYGVWHEGSSTTETTEGGYDRRSVRDSSGRELYTEGTGHYTAGTSKTTTTPGSYVPTPVAVNVHHTSHAYTMEGNIFVEGDVPTVMSPFSVSTTTTGETWEAAQALPPNGHWMDSKEGKNEPSGPSVMQDGMKSALEKATKTTEQVFASDLVKQAKSASGPDAVDKYAAALFLDPTGDAVAPLAEMLHVPAADLTAAVRPQVAFVPKSELAYKLDEPAALTDYEREQIKKGFGILRNKGTGAMFELLAGLQTSAPTHIEMGTNATAPDPSSSYGIGLGFRLMGGLDPGRADTVGLVGGSGFDFRLGYAGGVFLDLNVPIYLGMRVAGVGVAGKIAVGWSKLGKDESGDLWIRNSPYAGYGVDLSYLSWGLTDFAASFMHYSRSIDWQKPDDYDVHPGTLGNIGYDEDRYEMKVLRWADNSRDPSKTFSARYSKFTGDTKDGYSLTFWIAMMGFAE